MPVLVPRCCAHEPNLARRLGVLSSLSGNLGLRTGVKGRDAATERRVAAVTFHSLAFTHISLTHSLQDMSETSEPSEP